MTTLLCHRAEVNVASLEGLSPLHIAVEGAHTTVAQVLIQGIFLMNSQKEKKILAELLQAYPDEHKCITHTDRIGYSEMLATAVTLRV